MTTTTQASSGIFITGSDTGAGKTYFSCLLARELVHRGYRVAPRKPAESGCRQENGQLIPADALALLQASESSEPLNKICPYRFEAAVSPASAAAQTGQNLSIQQLLEACAPADPQAMRLVEGAGGFYSPLAADGLNADLAVALQLPLILVVADRLGCINHCLLSLEAIAHRGLHTVAIILNQTETEASASSDNLQAIRALTDIPVFYLAQGQNRIDPELFDYLPIPTQDQP